MANSSTEAVATFNLIQAALVHHQAGRLAQAEALYRQVLLAEPDNPDALHLLGALARQARKPDLAANFIRRAIRAKPAEPVFHNSLGLVLKDLGKPDEASASYRRALALKPGYFEACYNLGNVLQLLGRLDDAIASYRRAIASKPDYAEAYCNLGSALQAQGKPDEAIDCYRKAIAIRPNHAEAHFNLGNALQTRDRLDEAIASYRSALAINPDYAKAHSNLGKALQEQGGFDEAVACYRKAVALAPESAEMHCNLGGALRGLGNLDDAIASYHKAISLNPGFAEAYTGLGNALRENNLLDQSIDCYRKAIAIRPELAEAHHGMGSALQYQGRLTEASASLQQALSIKPDYAQARTVLAAICIDQGRFDDARVELEQALHHDPENPNAWAALASLRKMTPQDSAWLDTALRLLARDRPALSIPEEIKLQFAIGKYYDDTGQYDLAFPAYDRANALMRRVSGGLDRAEFSRLVDTQIATYAAEAMARQKEGASSSQLPVLVVGMPRSGTSLIEQIIASHPEACGAGELAFWGEWATRPVVHDPAFIAQAAHEYESSLQQHSVSAHRIVDKMPGNFLWLGLIHAVFPNAKIIHVRRNPVDTCLSIYFQNFSRAHSYKTSLDDLAYFYREYDRLMRHWRNVLPADRLLEISYEALTDNQAEESRRLIEFIGLEWDERCLDFHQTERKVGTSSNWQVRQKIYHTSRARWRNYEKHLGPLVGLQELEKRVP